MDRHCEVDGCEGRLYAKGLCNKHYQRLRANGDPLVVQTMRGAPTADRFWAKVHIGAPGDCWPFQCNTSRQGYGMFHLRGRNHPAHRVAFLLTHGHWPQPECLHSCDNPPCVNPAHLSEGTHSQNMQQMIERGRRTLPTGEAHSRSVLTAEKVREAQQLREENWTLRELADRYDVSISAVSHALRGETWRAEAQGYTSSVRRGGEAKRGEHHGMAQLAEHTVIEIRRRAAAGESRASLRERFGMSKSQIQRIVTGEAWSHVDQLD